MATDNLEIVKATYEAFARRDMAALQQLIDPEIEMFQTPLLPWGGRYRGTAGLMEFFGKLGEHLDSQPQPEEYVEAGENIVALGYVRGQVKANRAAFEVRIVHVWTLEAGKIRRFEAYIDTPAMLGALNS